MVADKSLFAPLVRSFVELAVSYKISIQDFEELVRFAYVKVTQDQIAAQQDDVTVSRVAALTGLHRREVTRLMKLPAPALKGASLTARILSRWENSKRYQTAAGKPKPLSYVGVNSEFARLARAESQDLNSATLAYQLVSLGHAVEKNGALHFVSGENLHAAQDERRLSVLARNVSLLFKSFMENSKPDVPRNFIGNTQFDNIYQADLGKIRKWIFDEGVKFHKRVRQYLAKYDADLSPNKDKPAGGSVALLSVSWSDSENQPNV